MAKATAPKKNARKPKAHPAPKLPGLDLDLAWTRLLSDSRDDLVPDALDYDDFKTVKTALRTEVEKRLKAGYEPSSLLRMDSPKGNLTLRGGAVPEIEDRIVYTAIAGFVADVADKSLEPESVVPSYRVRVGKRDEYLFHYPIT